MNIEDEFNEIIKNNDLDLGFGLTPELIEKALRLTEAVKSSCQTEVIRCLLVIAESDERLKAIEPRCWMATILTIITHLCNQEILTVNQEKGKEL